MKKISILGLFVFFCYALITGCGSKAITSQDVIGTYVANYDTGEVKSDSIEVKNDGSYIHIYRSAKDESKDFTNSGTWEIKNSGDTPRIFFNNFEIGYSPWTAHIPDDEKNLRVPGIWSPPVENGGQRLGISADFDLHYDKQE